MIQPDNRCACVSGLISMEQAWFVRYASVYVLHRLLQQWNLPHISASQQAKEAIVKRPKQIPAGSSREQIRAEAVSISDYSWILDGYSACIFACGDFPITAEQVRNVLAHKGSSRSKDQTGPRTTVDKNRSGSGSKPKAKKTKLYLSK